MVKSFKDKQFNSFLSRHEIIPVYLNFMKCYKLQYCEGYFRDTDKSECEISSFFGWGNNEYAGEPSRVRVIAFQRRFL